MALCLEKRPPAYSFDAAWTEISHYLKATWSLKNCFGKENILCVLTTSWRFPGAMGETVQILGDP